MDPEKRIGEALDPQRYTEHVVRTAMLLERLATDVKELKDSQKTLDNLRDRQGKTEREFEVFKVKTSSDIEINKETIRNLGDGLQWLRRLLVAALVSGIAGLVWASIK